MRSMLCALQRLLPRLRTTRSPFACVDMAPWPDFTVFVVARAQDSGLSACLQALLGTAYPAQALRIVPICEPGDAHAGAIIKAYAHLFPERVTPCRLSGRASSPLLALREALPLARGDLALVLDSQLLPGPGLLKQLARPFFDPEVGIVTGGPAGKATPRLGAVRLSAVEAAGGWAGEGLADLDRLTRRLQAAGWTRVVNPSAVWCPAPPARSTGPQGALAGEALGSGHEPPPPRRNASVLMEHT
jgi:cellulose synthase/poly-beta-1,6-N-acetylglucosamine synthase-like glycosyltransferase